MNKDPNIDLTIKFAFEKIVNVDSRVAKALVVYLDEMFKKDFMRFAKRRCCEDILIDICGSAQHCNVAHEPAERRNFACHSVLARSKRFGSCGLHPYIRRCCIGLPRVLR